MVSFRSIVSALMISVVSYSVIPASYAADWTSVDDATLERLATELQAGRDAQAIVETLKAIVASQAQENAKLRDALAQADKESLARTEAAIRADERSKLQTEQVTALKELITDMRADLKTEREYTKELRSQQKWDRILSIVPLLGLGLLLFGL